MSLERSDFRTRFDEAVSTWEIYCGSLSVQNNSASRTSGENYQNVVALGLEAVEPLFDRYGRTRKNTVVGVAWAQAIEDILQTEDPEFGLPRDIQYNPEKLKRFIGDYLKERKEETKVAVS